MPAPGGLASRHHCQRFYFLCVLRLSVSRAISTVAAGPSAGSQPICISIANGIIGQPLQIGCQHRLVFVLFGEMLYAIGGAAFLSDFALAVMGRFRGGQAKIAIVSSSLFGNISGSAVANVVVDGAFTIPMMKKAGYPAPVAAAIEAVASTGGQIMPPVMGAAAFLIAEYLAIPYAQVALAL